MDRVTHLKKFKRVRREPPLVDVIVIINSELLMLSKTSNFLFGCVSEFASHVTVSRLPTFVFVDNQTKSVF